ncbi:MAG: RelA/SpoT family protein [Gammaproteobacteria bacterium]|nr:MAG: RelA/SpoT family protein [Gammaproteobacteria bacterium]
MNKGTEINAEQEEVLLTPEPLFRRLITLTSEYLPVEAEELLLEAFQFSRKHHAGQYRKSGEEYVTHPLAVAIILAEMHMDPESIAASILHDIIEDTEINKQQLAAEFGESIAELVDGVTKLTQIHFEDKAVAQAENFRKMVLAMADDIRVIQIKLADRLHNMRTLGSMPRKKKIRISKETLDIYAPVASRLGMNTIRIELEDLCFETIHPMRARVLRDRVKKVRGNRKEVVSKIKESIQLRLEQEGINGKVYGREKHLYSLYKKMHNKALSFADVLDVFAFRVVVDTVDTCYRTLGSVHNLYKPVPGKFKDYVAIPKANGYQSLHTVLFGPRGVPIEIQIRSEDMQKVADSGIAAHWLYKSKGETSGSGSQAHDRAREWVRGLLEMQQSSGNSLEFIESVKIDLFPDEVYVFTPRGDIIELPRGATPVDFAYAVHSDIGDTCLAAKVDKRLVPLRTTLQTGQTVEIISAPGTKPNAIWLDFVITAKARSAIRHYLKKLKQDDAVSLGRRLVDKALAAYETSIDEISQQQMVEYLESAEISDLDELFESVGLGKSIPMLVAKRLINPADEIDTDFKHEDRRAHSRGRPLLIKGTEGMVVTFGRCCYPIPGDHIVGYASSGRGVVVHRRNCNNLKEIDKKPQNWVDVQWADEIGKEFPVNVRLDVTNQRGVLGSLAVTISDTGANIENVHVEEKEREGMIATLHFTIAVKDRTHLARVMRRLHAVPTVLRVHRCGA